MSVDSRVVDMKFNYQQFASGVSTVMGLLDRLKAKLNIGESAKGLDSIATSAKRLNFNPLLSSVDTVTARFSALQVAGIAALAGIANRAVLTGQTMLKSLTTAPISSGLKEYETNLNAIQTILANTQSSGATLNDVNKALNELNTYSDKTIYNFSEMARNIGTFTAAGVDLNTATQSIKGIANLAALSGSNSQQASTAMYQLSQAISEGRVSLESWNSVVTAGMGGTVFQRALAQTAVAMGTLKDNAVKLEGPMQNVKINGESFRNAVMTKPGEKSWLTSEVLTTALKNFTGDMKEADLVAQGFTKAQAHAIMAQAATASQAATVVKTGSQLMDTLREAAGSGWAQTWQIIFGDFNEAKTLWTGVNNVLGGMISASAQARNALLSDWKKLGGRTLLIEGISNAFQALLAFIKPIKDAFRNIFPAKTGKDLVVLTLAFLNFTEHLKIGGETAQNLRRTFAGVFAIFDIAKQIIGAVAGQFIRLFSSLGEGTGGILKFTAGIGMWLVALDKSLKKGDVFNKLFGALGDILAVPLKLLQNVAKAIGAIFSGFDPGTADKVGGAFDRIGRGMNPLVALGQRIQDMFAALTRSLGGFGDNIANALGRMRQAIFDAFNADDYSKVLDTINTGLFGALVLLFKKFTSGGLFNIDAGGGLVDSIKETLGAVTERMQVMQASVKADTILKIAAALALLTASITVLSLIDSAKLTKALVALTVGFGALQASLVLLSRSMGLIGATKVAIISGSLVALSASLLLIAAAMKIMATMSWEDIAKGLVGVGGGLAAIAVGMRLMPSGILLQATALLALGVALNAIAVAMKIMATMSWEEMAKGLVAVAGALAGIAIGMKLMPSGILLQSVAILALAGALNAISVALKVFATMSWEEMAKGLTTLAGSLTLIAIAMRLMPSNMLLQAVGLVAVGVALNLIAAAVKVMATMSWDDIGRGMVVLGGSLLILAAGLALMTGSLAGAAALLVAAGALAVLTPILITLGNLSWETIVTGLAALAGIFAVVGVAGLLLAPIVPVILALAASMLLIGAGMALAGAGVLAFMTALGIAAAGGAAIIAVMSSLFKTFIAAIPEALKALAQGVVAFAKVIAGAGKEFFDAISTVLKAIIDAIATNAPRIAKAFLDIIQGLVKAIADHAPGIIKGIVDFMAGVLRGIADGAPKVIKAFVDMLVNILTAVAENLPRLVAAGVSIIVSLLSGIANNIGRIVAAAVNVVSQFMAALGREIPKLVDQGAKMIIAFVNGVAEAIRANSGPLGQAGANLGVAIVEGMAKGIAGGLSVVTNAAKQLARSALDAAKGILGIHSPSKEFEKVGKFTVEGFAKGLTGNKDQILSTWTTMRDLLASAMNGSREDIAKLQDRMEALQARSKTLQDRLEELNGAKKRDTDAIKTANEALEANKKAIAENAAAQASAQAELGRTTGAYRELNSHLVDQRHHLEDLAGQYDRLGEKLKDAQDVLDQARKTRDDYAKNVSDTYSSLPDITPETQLGDYLSELNNQAVQTEMIAERLKQLRDMGLNDATYKELLAKGVDALPFVNQILSGGAESIKAVNELSAQLATASAKLGNDASKDLYDAGVQTAIGLVEGIKSQQSAVMAQMEALAEAMLSAMKNKLGIKSPSREFAALGSYSVEGMAKGLTDGGRMIETATANLGDLAVQSMKESLSSLSNILSAEMDVQPVIAPVLDLSDIRKGASQVGSMLTVPPIKVDAAYSSARQASAGYRSNQAAQQEVVEAPRSDAPESVTFIQNNSSPKALSQAEIYRRTNNQLSRVKGALTNA